MKKILSLTLCLALIFSLCACGNNGASVDIGGVEEQIVYEGEYTTKYAGTKLNVYNWGEYIDESIFEEFEAETGITVNYNTFSSFMCFS